MLDMLDMLDMLYTSRLDTFFSILLEIGIEFGILAETEKKIIKENEIMIM